MKKSILAVSLLLLGVSTSAGAVDLKSLQEKLAAAQAQPSSTQQQEPQQQPQSQQQGAAGLAGLAGLLGGNAANTNADANANVDTNGNASGNAAGLAGLAGLLGGNGGAADEAGLASLLGGAGLPAGLDSGMASNAAGVIQYCIKNNYLNADAAGGIKNRLLSALTGQPAQDPGYQQGEQGLLSGNNGQSFNLNSVTDKLKTKACDFVLDHAKSMI